MDKPQHERQGDVLLIKLPSHAKIGTHAKPLQPDPKLGVVLAYGEVTGHAHRLDPGVCCLYAEEDAVDGTVVEETLMAMGAGMVSHPADRFLEVKKATFLTHDEHDPHNLEPGLYIVRRQREYDPAVERLVAD